MTRLMRAYTSDQACIEGLIHYRLLKDGVEAGARYASPALQELRLMEQFHAHVNMPSQFMMDFSQRDVPVILHDDEEIDAFGDLDLRLNLDVMLNAAKDGVRVVIEDSEDDVIYSDVSIEFSEIMKAIHYKSLYGHADKTMTMLGIECLPVLNLIERTSQDFYGVEPECRKVLDEWLFAVVSGPMWSFIHKRGLKPGDFMPGIPFGG